MGDTDIILQKTERMLMSNEEDEVQHALTRVPVDASRWTPKGETKGLSTLYIQKEYHFDVGDTVLVFLCAEGKNFDHPQ